MSETDTSSLPPTPSNVIALAYVDLVIYVLLFIPGVWITWKHGKAGMVCWQIFLSYFIMRFVADIYQITHKNDPMIPNAVVTLTTSGGIACLMLTLIGLVYESNIILPQPPKRWAEKIILGVTHLFSTAAITTAMYGIAPTPPVGAPKAQNLAEIGNCIMLFVVFGVTYWIWPTYRKARSFRGRHPNAVPAMRMCILGFAAVPFLLVRLAANTTFAFMLEPTLDPVTGSFATKLVLVFLMQLITSLCFITAGWLGMSLVPKNSVPVAATDGVDASDPAAGETTMRGGEAGAAEDGEGIPLSNGSNWSSRDDAERAKNSNARTQGHWA